MEATLEAKAPVAPRKERLYTAKDLSNHPEWGHCELVRGKVVPLCLPKQQHALLTIELSRQLANFVMAGKLGQVGSEVGIVVERDPDTVRGPDLYFISAARKPKKGSTGYLEIPPELCIEVVSPKDRWTKIVEKARMYLAFGVKLVWVIDPKTQSVYIYREGDEKVEVRGIGGELSGEQILPRIQIAAQGIVCSAGLTRINRNH